jgi:hypothetical protein
MHTNTRQQSILKSYFVMKLNPDNEEYPIDQKNLLISFDHMLNDVIQHSEIEYAQKIIDSIVIPYF